MARLKLSLYGAAVLMLAALLPACGGEEGAAPDEAVSDRLNVLLITADDLGRTLGSYGDNFARTPNIDELAEKGVLFERAFVTQASCSSSRSSILTGLYPSQNGQLGLAGSLPEYRLKPGIATLPGLLRSAGYFTGILGKLHVAPSEAFPFDYRWADSENGAATRDIQQVRDRAEQFLTQARGKPFFLYVNLFDPHREFDAQSNQFMGFPADLQTADDIAPFPYLGLDGPAIREEIAIYYNAVSRLDTGVGLLLRLFEQNQLLENTLVIIVGDHGVPFIRAKTTSYEAGVAVPLIVVWPGVGVEGLRSEALVSTVDLLPTVLDAVGEEAVRSAGHSLRDVMWDTPPADWRKLLFTEYTSHATAHFYPRRSVSNGRFRLIHNLESQRANPIIFQGKARPEASTELDPVVVRAYETLAFPPAFELYDLARDPYERVNLAAEARYGQTLQELQDALLKWRESQGDPLLDQAEIDRLRRAHHELVK